MTEHAIRLRAAWDFCPSEGDCEVVRRVDLPTDWPIGTASPFRLRRKFGHHPPGDWSGSTRLELVGVPGLVAVSLNGRELRREPAGPDLWSIPLAEPLPPRSILVLEVDFRPLPGPPRDWGAIALVFSPGGARQGEPGDPGVT